MPLILHLTDAGIDALVAAESSGTDPILIAELGLTETAFDAAPTLTALPDEFKRVAVLSGAPVAANVIHMTAYDTSSDTYNARGLGLYLADGTLFATYGAAEPVLSKAALAFGLIAFDIAFSGDISGDIAFENAIFIYPPATEDTRGTARIATQARVDAVADGADDHETIVTPKTLRARLATFFASVTAAIDDLTDTVTAALAGFAARTVTGGGLVTGGGDLSANRVLAVTAASGADLVTGTDASKAVTPASVGSMPQTFGGSMSVLGLGGAIIKGGSVTVGAGGGTITFPVAFPAACDRVIITALGNWEDGDEDDESAWVTSVSDTGFTISVNAADRFTVVYGWVAFGH